MKKITLLTLAFTVILGAQMLAPTKSEAQITCSTDFYGNTRCVDNDSGNYSDICGSTAVIASVDDVASCPQLPGAHYHRCGVVEQSEFQLRQTSSV